MKIIKEMQKIIANKNKGIPERFKTSIFIGVQEHGYETPEWKKELKKWNTEIKKINTTKL